MLKTVGRVDNTKMVLSSKKFAEKSCADLVKITLIQNNWFFAQKSEKGKMLDKQGLFIIKKDNVDPLTLHAAKFFWIIEKLCTSHDLFVVHQSLFGKL